MLPIPLRRQASLLLPFLFLAACSSAEKMPSDIPPLEHITSFTCSDRTKFSIGFTEDNSRAYLFFPESAAPEILRSARAAGGIDYEGKRYAFEEHRGITLLVRIEKNNKKVPVKCKRDIITD